MFQLDARFTSLLSVLFIAVGLFNLYIGRKRMYALRKIGRPAIWYKQTNILTGFEYALLGIVLILNSGISSGFFTDAEGVYVIPIYTGALVLAAIILAFLLFQRVTSNRKRKALPTSPPVEQNTSEPETAQMTPQQRAAQAQRRRERRKNAASARRRQSGKA
jgi:lipoprotein signal peptidase